MISKENIIEKIIACSPWTEQFSCRLEDFGFREPKKAWNGFISLAKCVNFKKLYPIFFSKLLDLFPRSHNADLALQNLEHFSEKFQDKDHLFTQLTESKTLLEALIFLFSGSQILTDSLLNEPSYVNWLNQPGALTESKSKDMLMRDFYEMAGEESFHNKNTSSLLRRFKKRD